MIIRLHEPRDFEDIAELRWLLKTEDIVDEGLPDKADFIRAYVGHLKNQETKGQTAHWVLQAEDRVQGVMTVRKVAKETSLSGRTGTWGYLTNAFIQRPLRNQGFGTRMLVRLKDWSRSEDLEFLLVWPSMRSRTLYQRAGFTGHDDPLTLNL